MTDSAAARSAYLASVSALLERVFANGRYRGAYLDWLYERSPEGREIAADLFEGERCDAHYCVVPQTYCCAGLSLPMSLSLNTAVAPEARKKSVFTSLAESCFEKARNERGVTAVLGVANANSTHGFVNRLGFRLVMPLPVIVGISIPSRGECVTLDSTTAGASEIESFAAAGDFTPTDAWSQNWSPAKLAWRLKSPVGKFLLHDGPEFLAVSTLERMGGISIAVVAKVFGKPGKTLRTGRLLSSICAAHSTPFYLHCGVNARVRLPGLAPPRRFLPAPLNLIYRNLAAPAPTNEDFRLATFEFLDFDAY